MSCFICDKHLGNINQPPGGYIYEDEHWMVCHFPAQQSVLGRIVLESKRHFLDFSDMSEEEAGSYGVLIKKLYSALKQVTEAERVYSLVTIDGVPHFHVHFIPRRSDSPTKGMDFIKQDWSCSEIDAFNVARKLYLILNSTDKIKI
ncbi:MULTISPECIES: HIT family protein [unclassified Paenibacillus]|uniref:HIT family protein n=1 Tax=unclassified Paenibacillus TaxID=185978 RepID=UPI002784EFBB|nr:MULTISPECIES: HIT family protein [unclassified Paenibacillus]MDQ0896442.1 diadenosine tetraphosphate (Ap4A) HIT family hydrolase [Paenibacillus sp. V4I7]MDQ0914014.1 diadenosine tetraphosphate (Ap4A) HIT family hydrolase [Paenibacillus sp. V4I5]